MQCHDLHSTHFRMNQTVNCNILDERRAERDASKCGFRLLSSIIRLVMENEEFCDRFSELLILSRSLPLETAFFHHPPGRCNRSRWKAELRKEAEKGALFCLAIKRKMHSGEWRIDHKNVLCLILPGFGGGVVTFLFGFILWKWYRTFTHVIDNFFGHPSPSPPHHPTKCE